MNLVLCIVPFLLGDNIATKLCILPYRMSCFIRSKLEEEAKAQRIKDELNRCCTLWIPLGSNLISQRLLALVGWLSNCTRRWQTQTKNTKSDYTLDGRHIILRLWVTFNWFLTAGKLLSSGNLLHRKTKKLLSCKASYSISGQRLL